MSMELLDKSGLAYFWTKIKAYVAGLLSSKADDSDVVHKAGDENVTGTKTFVGSKKVAFKQSTANDKLGFTLFNNSNVEQGYLEYNPTNKISGVPLMTLGNYATAAAGRAYVGFRRYSSISGANGAYNLLTPLISDAKAPFNLTTTYTNFFLPLGVTDGTTIVVTDKSGLLDISSLLVSIDSSDAITAMTGYSKPSSGGAIVASDSLNAAIGKLEFKVDSVDDSNYVHLSGDETVGGNKTFSNTISGSIDGNAATASAVAWSGVTGKPTTIGGYGITDAKIDNGTITLGSNTITPLTSHQALPTLSRTISGSGNAITDITVSDHAITATKGATFLTSVSGTAGTSALSWDTEVTLYTVGGHAIKAKLPANPDTNTHWTSHLYAGASNGNANAATTNGNTYLIICDNSTARDRRLIKGTGATTVTSDANGVITIHSTDNNTTYSAATQSAAGLMSAADKKKLDGIEAGADNIPVGTVIYYAKSTVPTNFLICNGAAVSRTTYATLYGVIGTTFGKGNGSSTFNVPNLIDRFPEGNATPGTVKAAGLPNITGGANEVMMGELQFDGALKKNAQSNGNLIYQANASFYRVALGFDASKSNAIYGKSSTVQPPALTLVPCIRYV